MSKKKYNWQDNAWDAITDFLRFLFVFTISGLLWLGAKYKSQMVKVTPFENWIFICLMLLLMGLLLYSVFRFRFGNSFQVMGAMMICVFGLTSNFEVLSWGLRIYGLGSFLKILWIIGFDIKSKFYFRGKEIK